MLLLHLKRILFFGLLGLIGATAWILLSRPVYEARLGIQVGQSGQQAPDPLMPPEVATIVSRADSQQAATEVDILREQSLFAQALDNVDKLHAKTPPHDANYDKNLYENFKTYYRMYAVTGGPVQPDQSPTTISSLAEVTARAFDPDTAIDIATAVGDEYTVERQKALAAANERAEKTLADLRDFYKEKLTGKNGLGKDGLDHDLEKAKKDFGMSDVPLLMREIEDYVSQLQMKKDTLEAELHGSELELDRLRREFKSIPPVIVGPASKLRNPEIAQLDEKLSVARAELAAKEEAYLPNAREVKQIQDEITALEADLKQVRASTNVPQETSTQPNTLNQNIKSEIVSDAAKVDSLRAQLADVNEQLSMQKSREAKIPEAERVVNDIMRQRDLTEMKYKTVSASYDTIVNRVKAGALPAVIISYPMPALVKDPVEPNVPRTILIGLLAGLSLGAIFSAARESIKPLVFSATQLEQATGLPVVATIPRLPGGEVQRVRTLINSSRFPRKNFHDMASVVLAERESLPKTVVVCGVDGDSSSSLAAISYAAALARAGLRVTLVDANPAKVITRAFDMEADNGIVDYLTQAALISQKALAQFSMLTKHNELLGCKICSFGTADVKTLTDFSDDRVAGIIEALKPDSDVLIIETAPSGRQPDAVRMARHADEVLATFESGTSNDRSVDTLRDLFTEAGVKKMSMVLTNTLERVA